MEISTQEADNLKFLNKKDSVRSSYHLSTDLLEYKFRRAKSSDARAVVALLHQMFTVPPRGFDERKARSIVRSFASNNKVYHLVVDWNGIVIAAVLGYFIDYARFGRRMFIEDFVVDQAHRRKGLGRAMLNHLREVAKKKGCTGIVLHTGKNNYSAQKFYRANGMEENVMFKAELD